MCDWKPWCRFGKAEDSKSHTLAGYLFGLPKDKSHSARSSVFASLLDFHFVSYIIVASNPPRVFLCFMYYMLI